MVNATNALDREFYLASDRLVVRDKGKRTGPCACGAGQRVEFQVAAQGDAAAVALRSCFFGVEIVVGTTADELDQIADGCRAAAELIRRHAQKG